jgi:hypothetical protein
MQYKLGRRPGTIPIGLHDLTFYAAGPLPKAPASLAVPSVAAWGMLGNNQYGDCGVAGLEHVFMAAAADTDVTGTFATDQQAISYYLTYTGGQDDGVVLSQYLAYVRQKGYYGQTLTAYAPVGVHDVPTLQTATWMYDATYTGIEVTEQMQTDFSNGQPWTMQSLDSPTLGGHCVPIVGYDNQYLYVVTWGGVQAIEYSAWHYLSSEAWAVIVGELSKGDGHGVLLAALQADLNKLAN